MQLTVAGKKRLHQIHTSAPNIQLYGFSIHKKTPADRNISVNYSICICRSANGTPFFGVPGAVPIEFPETCSAAARRITVPRNSSYRRGSSLQSTRIPGT
jgi:hypothetical protein